MKNACGPACIEMIFNYWGEKRWKQKQVATEILHRFPKVKRYKECGILETSPTNFRIYPGTGTSTMREFLKRHGTVDNFKIKETSNDVLKSDKERSEMFQTLKGYIRQATPVIVHQYTSLKSKSGHYRVVTGYDEEKELVFLNDPRPKGGRIEQSYDLFFQLWNVDEPWLHYNAIAFKPGHLPLKADLESQE